MATIWCSRQNGRFAETKKCLTRILRLHSRILNARIYCIDDTGFGAIAINVWKQININKKYAIKLNHIVICMWNGKSPALSYLYIPIIHTIVIYTISNIQYSIFNYQVPSNPAIR